MAFLLRSRSWRFCGANVALGSSSCGQVLPRALAHKHASETCKAKTATAKPSDAPLLVPPVFVSIARRCEHVGLRGLVLEGLPATQIRIDDCRVAHDLCLPLPFDLEKANIRNVRPCQCAKMRTKRLIRRTLCAPSGPRLISRSMEEPRLKAGEEGADVPKPGGDIAVGEPAYGDGAEACGVGYDSPSGRAELKRTLLLLPPCSSSSSVRTGSSFLLSESCCAFQIRSTSDL